MPSRRSPFVLLLALVAVGLLLTGCSTTRLAAGPDGQVDTGGADPAPGINGNTVSIGIEAGDINALHKAIGFTGVPTGSFANMLKGIDAIVSYINANGGLGGRTLNAIISKNAPDPDAECRKFTQDTPVFAVVLTGVFTNSTRPCYIAAHTTMIDLTPIAHDQNEFNEDAPYLWAPDQPELGAFVRAQVQSLAKRGWFAGSTGVAVVAPDAEVSRRVSTQIVVPELKSVGVTNIGQYYIDASSIGTLGQSSSAALEGVRDGHLDRVFVVGGARILGIMASDSNAIGLPAEFSISTVDLPEFIVDNPNFIVDSVTNGMAGLGYSTSGDLRLSSEPFPNPANPTEVLCKKIIDDAGAAPPQGYRENYSVIFPYCDALLMLKAGFDKAPAGHITPDQFRDAIWSLGSSLQMAIPDHVLWRPGNYAPVSSARPLAWIPTCVLPDRTRRGCFEYVGGPVSLVSGSATADASPGSQATSTPWPTITMPSR